MSTLKGRSENLVKRSKGILGGKKLAHGCMPVKNFTLHSTDRAKD